MRQTTARHPQTTCLADQHLAAVGAGQEADVAAHSCAHLLAAVGRWVGAEHERQEPVGFFQSRPDVFASPGGYKRAGSPTATQPMGIRVSGGTTHPIWTAPPRATLLARPICAPLKTLAPVAMNTSSPTVQPVR